MAMILCPICGMSVPDEEKTCKYCGSMLKPGAAPVLRQEAAPEGAGVPSEEPNRSEEAPLSPREAGRGEDAPVPPEETGRDERATLPESAGAFPSGGVAPGFSAEEPPVPYQPEFPHGGDQAAKKKKKQTVLLIVCIVLAVLIGTAAALTIVSVNKEKERKAQEEYRARYNEYADNLEKIQVLMFTGCMDAETLCNETLAVWYNTIYKIKDPETDPYTCPGGIWVSDFNKSLRSLYGADATVAALISLRRNEAQVEELMEELEEPPEGMEKCYALVTELYDFYKDYLNLVQNPSGSYRSFYSDLSSITDDFIRISYELRDEIPEHLT